MWYENAISLTEVNHIMYPSLPVTLLAVLRCRIFRHDDLATVSLDRPILVVR